MEGLQAAIKLVSNLLEQFEPEDAATFAAFVLAKVSHDSHIPIQTVLKTVAAKWAQVALAHHNGTQSVLGHEMCSCGLACAVRQTPQGPVMIHYGAACHTFQNRFPPGHYIRAQDGVGWNNWHSEENDPPRPNPSRWDMLEMDNPEPKKPPANGEDDARIRFSMLEMDPT